jgi:hypothetical protein
MKAPDEIYLQGYIGHDTEGVTWCEDQINDDDVRYVRADLAARRTVSGQECAHEIVDARNEYVESGFMCVKCNAVFAGRHAAPIPATELTVEGIAQIFDQYAIGTVLPAQSVAQIIRAAINKDLK